MKKRAAKKKPSTKRGEPEIDAVGRYALKVANEVGGESYRMFCRNANIDPRKFPEAERFYKAGIVCGIPLVCLAAEEAGV
jgi:hypothetical protein